MTHSKGFLISFEGCEAVGKTTIIKLVQEKLLAQNYDVMRTREPGGTKYAEKIRELIFASDAKPSPHTEALLMFAARREHIEHIIAPALNAGKIVLCDRYVDSSFVYQGLLGGLSSHILQNLCDDFVAPYMPHLSFLLSARPEICLERMALREKSNRNDRADLEFLSSLCSAYLNHSVGRDYMRVVDAQQTPENMVMDIIGMIEKALVRK